MTLEAFLLDLFSSPMACCYNNGGTPDSGIAAFVFGFMFRNALLVIFSGVIMAGVVMTLLTVGINIFNGI